MGGAARDSCNDGNVLSSFRLLSRKRPPTSGLDATFSRLRWKFSSSSSSSSSSVVDILKSSSSNCFCDPAFLPNPTLAPIGILTLTSFFFFFGGIAGFCLVVVVVIAVVEVAGFFRAGANPRMRSIFVAISSYSSTRCLLSLVASCGPTALFAAVILSFAAFALSSLDILKSETDATIPKSSNDFG